MFSFFETLLRKIVDKQYTPYFNIFVLIHYTWWLFFIKAQHLFLRVWNLKFICVDIFSSNYPFASICFNLILNFYELLLFPHFVKFFCTRKRWKKYLMMRKEFHLHKIKRVELLRSTKIDLYVDTFWLPRLCRHL